MKKRLSVLLALALLGTTIMAGCGKEEKEIKNDSMLDSIKDEVKVEEPETVVEETQEEESTEGKYQSELTGLWIDESLKDQRPLAVMVDNEKTALPHYGTSDADIVYEMMNSTANDRVTRLMVIMKDWKNLERLGSIRSVRPTNVILAAEYNAILCHDGGPFYIDPYIAKSYNTNISGGFSRIDNGKAREFTEYLTQEDASHPDRTLDARIEQSKVKTEYTKDDFKEPHFNFADEEFELDDKDAIDATEIVLPFKHNGSTLKYNKDTGLYEYYEYGSQYKDEGNGSVLAFKNLILEKCTFHQYDENGYLIYNCLDKNLDGYYITNGKAIPIKWWKIGETAFSTFLKKNDDPLVINRGKTYISLVPDDGWKNLSIK
ncbi:MAG: DUF3048 domain-containing protein [Lachnospiraceae bacterium]|jgi:hypothetical protein|nr:DUF3048 domain-containing protein [Lachnospiraceae bacterium]